MIIKLLKLFNCSHSLVLKDTDKFKTWIENEEKEIGEKVLSFFVSNDQLHLITNNTVCSYSFSNSNTLMLDCYRLLRKLRAE